MIGAERHEYEHAPRWQGIELATLRPNDDRIAEQLRQSLPIALGEVLAEVPNATLRLSLLADLDGMVAANLAAEAGEATAALATAVAGILQPVAETATSSEWDDVAWVRWPIIAEHPSGAVGFRATDAGGAGTLLVPMRGDDDAGQLVEDLAALPGHGLCVELRVEEASSRPRWDAQLWVLTSGEAPSLRMRATIRRRFPNLQIAVDTMAVPARVRFDARGLPTVLAVPVAGPTPLAGMYPGPAAAIAMAPTRRGLAQRGLRIGQAVTGGGRRIPVELTETERLRHVHVLGQTGTGKSSALAGMVAELAACGDGALIADPHGQLCDRILAELPDTARDRVWMIRCGDVDNPVPVNPLAENDPVRRDIAIEDTCASFQYLFDKRQTGMVGPRFHHHVTMTLRALAAVHGTRASILDVPVATADERFMTVAVARADDGRLKNWWSTFQLASRSNEHGEILAWVNSKFAALSGTAAMRAILGSGADAIDFAAAMDEGRIILLDLSKATLGESASRLLGYLYLSRVWEAALRRQHPQRPFTVMVDEAHTLISGALTNMLAEGRKFGLSVVLAHQYLDQLDEDLRPAVDGNVATTIAFRCAAGDASQLVRRLGDTVHAAALVTLPDLNAITLRTAAPGASFPHTLMIDYNNRAVPRRNAELASHTSAVMRSTYRDLVDPHREKTAAAATGISNIVALAVKLPPIPRPDPPNPGSVMSGAHGDPSSSKGGSFLDEWLAKRTKVAAPSTDDTKSGCSPVEQHPPAAGDGSACDATNSPDRGRTDSVARAG